MLKWCLTAEPIMILPNVIMLSLQDLLLVALLNRWGDVGGSLHWSTTHCPLWTDFAARIHGEPSHTKTTAGGICQEQIKRKTQHDIDSRAAIDAATSKLCKRSMSFDTGYLL